MNEASAEKDKVQQERNKKVENEQPKASGTLKVENSPPAVKKMKIIIKQSQSKKMKSLKRKEKVIEKEKALPAFDRNDDKMIVVNYLVILKSWINPTIKAIYIIWSRYCASNNFTYFSPFIQ